MWMSRGKERGGWTGMESLYRMGTMNHVTAAALSASGRAALVFSLLVLWAPAAWACSCAAAGDDELVENSDLAMVANAVIDAPFDVWAGDPQTPLPPPRAVTIFRVERVLKGPPVPGRIAVVHETDPGACGIGFTIEEHYLLAFRLRKADEPGPLQIGLCRVRTVDAAQSRGGE